MRISLTKVLILIIILTLPAVSNPANIDCYNQKVKNKVVKVVKPHIEYQIIKAPLVVAIMAKMLNSSAKTLDISNPEEMRKYEENMKKELENLTYTINMIRVAAFDKEIHSYTCMAVIEVHNKKKKDDRPTRHKVFYSIEPVEINNKKVSELSVIFEDKEIYRGPIE